MFMRQGGFPLSANDGPGLIREATLPDALEAWLGPAADAAAALDNDDLTDEEFAEKLKRCGDLRFGDSGAFEKLETDDMENAYASADHGQKR